VTNAVTHFSLRRACLKKQEWEMKQLSYRFLTEEDKRLICGWKYTGAYEVYNLPAYEEMKARRMSFMDPQKERNFLAFLDGNMLVGFVNIQEKETEVFIGIGVRPDLCGRHYGRGILGQACGICKARYPHKPLYLQVRTWNTRAVKCYENAGFRMDGEPYEMTTGIGTGRFYRMVKE